MSDPFLIEGPAVISFSGGRTSGYMLRRILDAGLQPDVHVLFANTGKERIETLRFVHEIEMRWDVPVHWLEYRLREDWLDTVPLPTPIPSSYLVETTYHTASRDGEPFEALISKRGLPNPVFRFCTKHVSPRRAELRRVTPARRLTCAARRSRRVLLHGLGIDHD